MDLAVLSDDELSDWRRRAQDIGDAEASRQLIREQARRNHAAGDQMLEELRMRDPDMVERAQASLDAVRARKAAADLGSAQPAQHGPPNPPQRAAKPAAQFLTREAFERFREALFEAMGKVVAETTKIERHRAELRAVESERRIAALEARLAAFEGRSNGA